MPVGFWGEKLGSGENEVIRSSRMGVADILKEELEHFKPQDKKKLVEALGKFNARMLVLPATPGRRIENIVYWYQIYWGIVELLTNELGKMTSEDRAGFLVLLMQEGYTIPSSLACLGRNKAAEVFARFYQEYDPYEVSLRNLEARKPKGGTPKTLSQKRSLEGAKHPRSQYDTPSSQVSGISSEQPIPAIKGLMGALKVKESPDTSREFVLRLKGLEIIMCIDAFSLLRDREASLQRIEKLKESSAPYVQLLEREKARGGRSTSPASVSKEGPMLSQTIKQELIQMERMVDVDVLWILRNLSFFSRVVDGDRFVIVGGLHDISCKDGHTAYCPYITDADLPEGKEVIPLLHDEEVIAYADRFSAYDVVVGLFLQVFFLLKEYNDGFLKLFITSAYNNLETGIELLQDEVQKIEASGNYENEKAYENLVTAIKLLEWVKTILNQVKFRQIENAIGTEISGYTAYQFIMVHSLLKAYRKRLFI